MEKLKIYREFDLQILDEVNVKDIRRPICTTEEGDLVLVFDGDYRFELGGADCTTDRLLDELAPQLLEKVYGT